MFRRLRSDLPLIVPALFIAFVIWLIAKQGDLGEDTVTVPVELENVASTMDVTADPATVDVKVRFPRELANSIVPRNFSVSINVQSLYKNPINWQQPTVPEKVQYTLGPRDVNTQRLPHTVQVDELMPDNVTLTATVHTVWADVKVATIGKLPPTLQFIAPPNPDPNQVLVTGPPDALRHLTEDLNKQIDTTTVDLSGLKGSGQVFRNLVLPDGLEMLKPREKNIAIAIGLTERSTTRTLEGVPVNLVTYSEGLTPEITPPTVNILIEGPPSALNTITPDQSVFSTSGSLNEKVGHRQEVGLVARLGSRVPSEVAQKVQILECRPPRVAVEFVKQTSGGASGGG